MLTTVARTVGGRTLTLETGKMAKQADGAVLARYGDTMVLATAVMSREPNEKLDFFPLTVEYRERSAAAGKFPGGFFKREGRPTEKEILTCRVVDRYIRPLFSKSIRNEVQICCSVLSADEMNEPDVIAMVAAAAAIGVSDLPIKELLGAVRVGRVDGELLINPSYEQMEKSSLNLVVAGKEDAVLMVEAGANEESEEVLVDALEFGHNEIKAIAGMIGELAEKVGKPKRAMPETQVDVELQQAVERDFGSRLLDAVQIADKQEREGTVDQIVKEALENYVSEEDDSERELMVKELLHDLERRLVRERIIKEGLRSDGRTPKDIRPISAEVGAIPRTHGSAMFTRGQTQALATATLGTVSDQQQVDTLLGESFKRFMLHYNFPPFSVGEARPIRGPGRREIGHGALAERALLPVLPHEDDFPYTIRIISDILESNGSSSMASICGGSLSLMDAGVPVKSSVAGIAMGLIKEGENIAILTDILGQEDHMGDMDFKVAGTRSGVTALQMDLKLEGVTRELLSKALDQAREARLFILDKMDQVIGQPRESISPHAPRIVTLFIDKSKIGDVIGPGGKTIRGIIEETGVKIDIDDDGRVVIASTDQEASQQAVEMVNYLTEEAEIGKLYKGKVTRILNFGAFVEILPGTEGLVHISQLADDHVRSVEDVVKEGDEIQVKVTEVDHLGRINLSKKDADWELAGNEPREATTNRRDRGGDRNSGRGRADNKRGSKRNR